ncbi:hypothetical protein CBM2623_A270038 [Cupriavidus taiwanensis]|nr:hypothetical protein CBM2608_A280039 [Cupriavidus taiwanensis]SPA28243.1 hypothetical protein CBM2623_A270038 [Cupriavidus taiwanensis]
MWRSKTRLHAPPKQSSKRTYETPRGNLPRASRRRARIRESRRACSGSRDATRPHRSDCRSVAAMLRGRRGMARSQCFDAAALSLRCLRDALSMLLRCKPLRTRITRARARRWYRAATDAGVAEHRARRRACVPGRVCKACRARAGVRGARVSKRAAALRGARRSRIGASPAKPLSMRLLRKREGARQSFSQSPRTRSAACHRYAGLCVKAAARAFSDGAARGVREHAWWVPTPACVRRVLMSSATSS